MIEIMIDGNPTAEAALAKAISGALQDVYGAPSTSPGTPPVTGAAAQFFPASASNAPFPSPDNSTVTFDGTSGGGTTPSVPTDPLSAIDLVTRPVYLRDNESTIWRFEWPTPTGASQPPAGEARILKNGRFFTQGTAMIIRQGKFYWQEDSYWRKDNGSGGSVVVNPLPAPFGKGNLPPSPPPPPGMPADPPKASVQPGSTGVVVTMAADETFTAALARCNPGDTLKLVPGKRYNEPLHAIGIPLRIDGGGSDTMATGGAILDGKGMTSQLAQGKGGLVPTTDCEIAGIQFINWGIDDAGANFIGAIRAGDPGGWYKIRNCYFFECQLGLASGGFPTVWDISDCTIKNCGNGSGQEHNIYLGGQVVRATLTNVVSTVDALYTNADGHRVGGGYPLKSRAAVTLVKGGTYNAFDAACMDIPDGSAQQCVIDGAHLIKPAGSPDHKVLNYAEESANNGAAGAVLRNCILDLACVNPLFLTNGPITIEASCKFTGNKPAVQGSGAVTGL